MCIENDIRSEAMALSVSLFGISKFTSPPHYACFLKWIDEGRHASMAYLARTDTLEKRKSPKVIMPAGQAMLTLGFNYPNLSNETDDDQLIKGKIASFAMIADYHEVLPQILKKLVRKINTMTDQSFNHRIYTDTGPILERDFGQLAGLGWVGKNSSLISPYIGSFFFLSEILLTLPLKHTNPFEKDYCGSCTRCIDACPTNCIGENRTIDARKCISYLTIENKGGIPRALRSRLEKWIFGCDICQNVCPWNSKFGKSTPNPIFSINDDWINICLHDELLLTDTIFRNKFKHSPILRAKRNGFLRNILCALGQNSNPESIPHLERFLEHEKDVILREHAFWALGQIRTRRSKALLEFWRLKETGNTLNEIRLSLEEYC